MSSLFFTRRAWNDLIQTAPGLACDIANTCQSSRWSLIGVHRKGLPDDVYEDGKVWLELWRESWEKED